VLVAGPHADDLLHREREGDGDVLRQHRTVPEAEEVDLGERGVDQCIRIVTTLSGGEQHRAHFARVLVQLGRGEQNHGPGLLLLDEPTAALDLRHQIDFVASIRARAAAGTAAIAVLHDLNLAAALADRVVALHRGRVAADGPPRTVITPDMLARVFDVALTSCSLPVGVPCVLPHMIAPRARNVPLAAKRHDQSR
jgi:iron complex transport system ATP-binding protein